MPTSNASRNDHSAYISTISAIHNCKVAAYWAIVRCGCMRQFFKTLIIVVEGDIIIRPPTASASQHRRLWRLFLQSGRFVDAMRAFVIPIEITQTRSA